MLNWAVWLGARFVWVAAALVGCGRYSFDPRDRVDGSTVDSDDDDGCESTFCDDFDREGPLEGPWDLFMNTGGAVGSLDAQLSVSSPNAFLLELPQTQLHDGMLVKQLGPAQSSIQVKFAMRYDSTNASTAEIDLVRLRWLTLPTGCTSFGYFLVRDSTGPFDLQETYGGCGGNENTPFDSIENTGFHEIELRVEFGPVGTASVRVDIDEITRVDKLTSHAIDPSMIELQVGGSAVRDMFAPWAIYYDDVEVDVL